VESLTALVEHFDGRLEIVRWVPIVKNRQVKTVKLSHNGHAVAQ